MKPKNPEKIISYSGTQILKQYLVNYGMSLFLRLVPLHTTVALKIDSNTHSECREFDGPYSFSNGARSFHDHLSKNEPDPIMIVFPKIKPDPIIFLLKMI